LSSLFSHFLFSWQYFFYMLVENSSWQCYWDIVAVQCLSYIIHIPATISHTACQHLSIIISPYIRQHLYHSHHIPHNISTHLQPCQYLSASTLTRTFTTYSRSSLYNMFTWYHSHHMPDRIGITFTICQTECSVPYIIMWSSGFNELQVKHLHNLHLALCRCPMYVTFTISEIELV